MPISLTLRLFWVLVHTTKTDKYKGCEPAVSRDRKYWKYSFVLP
jgi:hypothetical protein